MTIVDKLNSAVIDSPKTVILVFLLLTGVFLIGATQISTDSGTSQFTDNIPSQQALESINEDFSQRTIGRSSAGETLLIYQRDNVLSKNALVEILRFEKQIYDRDNLRVENIDSIASAVANDIDSDADKASERINAVESATESEVRDSVKRIVRQQGFSTTLSNDYNSESVSASGSISTVSHSGRAGSSADSSSAGVSNDPPLQQVQLDIKEKASGYSNSIIVFGSGIQSDELSSVSQDSLSIVIPVAITLILIFLVIAYRDPFDIAIALISLIMNVIWTFGFMGFAGIPFTQILVSVPPLLLAVGIDFGIHSINRYREEIDNYEAKEAMSRSNSQLIIAFGIVAGSTTIGFGSNVISPLQPIQQFGIVASVGVIFTFVIFGIFLPALKLQIDSKREQYSLPEFASSPLGEDESRLGKILVLSAYASERIPKLFVLLIILFSLILGAYGTGLSGEFSNEIFLPPENLPLYIDILPLDIGPYETPAITNTIQDEFTSFGQSTLILYVQHDMRQDSTLEQIDRLGRDPPNPVVEDERREAKMTSIVDIVEQSKRNPEFKQLVEENDRNNNGIPDQNLDKIYDRLSDINPQTSRFITDNRDSTRVIVTVKEDSSNKEVKKAGFNIADGSRMDVSPTGEAIILRDVSSFLVGTTTNSMILALVLTTLYLSLVYKRMDGIALYGIINMIPVFVTVAAIAATMRALSIPLNPITATTLSITIGIGVDYTIHMTHRITDEIQEQDDTDMAIRSAVKGTGGALFGSMATTAFGTGSLALSITPLLGQFGLIIAIGIFYSFLFSILMIPSLFRIYLQINSDSTKPP